MTLKASEISFFKTKLVEMRAQILQIVEASKKEVTAPDETKGYSQHAADEGTDDFVKQVNLEVANKELTLLRLIDRALQKIEEGTYGICDLSGEEIPFKRLDAIPYATMTVQAQEKYEKGLL